MIKAPADSLDNLSLIFRTHMVKGENWILQIVPDLHMVAYMYPYIDTLHKFKCYRFIQRFLIGR